MSQPLLCESQCEGGDWRGNETQPLFFVPSAPLPHASSHSPFSPALIAIVGILALAFLLVSYYTIFSKYCTPRDALARRARLASRQDVSSTDDALPILTRGLEAAVIRAIPVCKYVRGNGVVEVTECAVCLSEFQDNEFLRLLPKCRHAFHIPCIDKWLQSHSTCPLCRANIISPLPAPSVVPPVLDTTSDNQLPEPSFELEDCPDGNHDSSVEDNPPHTSTSEELTEANVRLHRESRQLHRESRQLLKYEVPASPKHPDGQIHLVHMRSFSVGSSLNIAHTEGKRKQVFLDLKRSFSLESSRRQFAMEFTREPEWVQGNVTDCRSERETELFSTEEPESACMDLEKCATTVVVEIPATGSSSSQVTNDNFNLKSLQHQVGLRNKVDNLPRAKVLPSLKDSLSLKRSFSGGRIFSFMSNRGRNTMGADFNRPSV